MSGAGSAKVHAKKSLEVEINGVGAVKYRGNPAKVKTEAGMLGHVEAE